MKLQWARCSIDAIYLICLRIESLLSNNSWSEKKRWEYKNAIQDLTALIRTIIRLLEVISSLIYPTPTRHVVRRHHTPTLLMKISKIDSITSWCHWMRGGFWRYFYTTYSFLVLTRINSKKVMFLPKWIDGDSEFCYTHFCQWRVFGLSWTVNPKTM